MHIVLGAEAANLPEFPSITGRELRDAELISDSMKGMGTKDELLIIRFESYYLSLQHVVDHTAQDYPRSLESPQHGCGPKCLSSQTWKNSRSPG